MINTAILVIYAATLVTIYWAPARRYRLVTFILMGGSLGFMATDIAVRAGLYQPTGLFGDERPTTVFGMTETDAVKLATGKMVLRAMRQVHCPPAGDGPSSPCIPETTLAMLKRIDNAKTIDEALALFDEARSAGR